MPRVTLQPLVGLLEGALVGHRHDFGEVAHPMQAGGVALVPFAGLAYVSVDTDSFRERGGPLASSRGVNIDQDMGYTTVGLRAARTMMWGETQITPHLSAAWLHAFDDVTPEASLAFADADIGSPSLTSSLSIADLAAHCVPAY